MIPVKQLAAMFGGPQGVAASLMQAPQQLSQILFPNGFEGGVLGAGRPVQDFMAQQSATAKQAYGDILKRTGNQDLAGAVYARNVAGKPSLDNPLLGWGVGSTKGAGMLDDLAAKWSARGVKNSITENGGKIVLNKVVVPKEARGQGIGSEFMKDLVAYADATGKRLALSPSTDFGGSSVARLINFYKRFGLIENKGRGKDFSVSETMIREPKK